MTLTTASRGSPRSRTARPTIASLRATGNSRTSAPRRRIVPDSASGRGSAGSSVVTPSRLASGSNVVPCRIVDSSTTKNTMLKNSCERGMRSMTGNVASTTGTAPRSPAQPRTACSRQVKPNGVVHRTVASGRATNTSTSARTVPSSATPPRSDGKTNSPRTRNIDNCATHAMPSWNVAIVCLAGIVAEPSISPVM